MPKPLSIDKPLDGNLKPVKDLDGTISAIELSTGKVRVKDLDVLGNINVGGNSLVTGATNIAGEILGYRMIGESGLHTTYTLTTTMTVPNALMTTRFIAPIGGAVEVMVQVFLDSNQGRIVTFNLSDNATFNSLGDTYEQLTGTVDESDQYVHQHFWTITGLTAGDTYNYWFGAKSNGGYIRWGGTSTGRYCDFIMKVTALPAPVADFVVYG